MNQLFEEDAGNPQAKNETEERQPGGESKPLGEQAVLPSPESLSAANERYREAAPDSRSGEVDLPSVDDITEDSDVSMFMATHVSEDVRRSALRKLFQTAKFNRRDGLDVYCADYNLFEPLGNIVTADMRHRLERMAAAATDRGEAHATRLPERPKKATSNPPEQAGETQPGALDGLSGPAPETFQIDCKDEVAPPFRPAAICGHGAHGLNGCTRCVDACPVGALVSAGNSVRFDPARCRGTGLCASACPTADLTPDTAAVLESVCRRLQRRPNEGGRRQDVFLHDERLEPDRVESFARAFASEAIVLPVASIASMGAEVFLAMLAFGASRVVLLVTNRSGDAISQAIEGQVAFASAVMDGLGLGGVRVVLARLGSNAAEGYAVESMTDVPGHCLDAAPFSPAGSRRALLFQCVDRLWKHSLTKPAHVLLPPGSPFGSVVLDPAGCTLCMACVGVCPSGALSSGVELPEIYFREGACFQCGLCRNVCPENAIRLSPRLLFGSAARSESLLQRRADPFRCVVCGQPFAAAPMIAGMIQKLAGHKFYKDETARRRLQMCADCRVRDIYLAGGFHVEG